MSSNGPTFNPLWPFPGKKTEAPKPVEKVDVKEDGKTESVEVKSEK